MAPKPAGTLEKKEANDLDIGDRKRKQTTSRAPRRAATKSKYFEPDPENESEVEDGSSSAVVESEDDSDISSEEFSDTSQRPQKRRAPASSKVTDTAPITGSKGKELWRQGVNTGLAPGTQIIIKRPKPRTAGNTPYADNTIHPNTMLFLKDLKANNDREWLKMYDADYRSSLKDWNSFVEVLTEELTKIDDTIPELPLKDVVFRIYRDIRFSKDPTPYKPYFSAAWSRTGRKGPYAAYYVQISPGESFVGGGYWSPDARALAALRNTIDHNPQRLKDVLMNDTMRAEFLSGSSSKSAVKAFVKTNAETALKTKPKGYDAGHPDIDLLRLRRFTVGTKLMDAEILDTQVLRRITALLSALHPFVACLNRIVLPDPSEEEEEDDDEDDSEDEAEDGEDEGSEAESSDA
ncbi:hypothetical protein AUEXF2481DRAFT_44040 [Aureobasidium subglaciale EXF-2481]|uniref:DUF2461 domain-containing protein n=1 Tax=Aureobasidium subglaciale (strain EXF-2481) TaxID=1043005 RepID=A0A074Y138_AURSE|nr:uncharacterized protein AUEXF2481DRAFT_44040 [Aureobasidium subglaciale EXF-2481]KEQ91455.1 hypothetical protein AUEXF2481DRAFT_44040 [Aureobasidium subglaciale EXF-2481]